MSAHFVKFRELVISRYFVRFLNVDFMRSMLSKVCECSFHDNCEHSFCFKGDFACHRQRSMYICYSFSLVGLIHHWLLLLLIFCCHVGYPPPPPFFLCACIGFETNGVHSILNLKQQIR
jgi:hypothetical protein